MVIINKGMILKLSVLLLFVFALFVNGSELFAISNEFENMINTFGIPKYNSNRDEINEDVYNVYKIFSYSAPERYSGTNPKQRWKDSKYGLWNKSGGSYIGSGIRGEYMVLGKNYGGAVINNYYFPLDTISPTTPEQWSYYTNPGALESWSDYKAYRFDEQRDYMKQAKLMFNDLSSRDNADNPDKFKEYNITSNSIGLDKAKMDTSSTWKTRGVISVKFKRDGMVRYAYFFTNPIAANANVKSNITNIKTDYKIDENSKDIVIPIEYNSEAINLTGYANKDHIKEIKSEIYINNEKVGEISGSKTTNVGNKYNFVVSRQTPNLSPNNKFVIRVDSYMYTEFAIDGVMKDSIQKTINVSVEPEKVEPIKAYSIRQIEKDNLSMVVRPLAQTTVTSSTGSVGLVEAGRKLAVKLDLNVPVDDIKNQKIYIGKNNIDRTNLSIGSIIPIDIKEKLYSEETNSILIDFEIPKKMTSTIYGWKSLREDNLSYFSVRQENNIGQRKDNPYILYIEYEYENVKYNYEILIDTTDDYISNNNYTIENQVINKQEISNAKPIQSWINNEV